MAATLLIKLLGPLAIIVIINIVLCWGSRDDLSFWEKIKGTLWSFWENLLIIIGLYFGVLIYTFVVGFI